MGRKLLIGLVIVVLAIVVLTIIGNKPVKQAIVGHWVAENGAILIFAPQELMYLGTRNNGQFLCYAVIRDDLVVWYPDFGKIQSNSTKRTYDVSINNTTLTSTIDGSRNTYSRTDSSGELNQGDLELFDTPVNKHCPDR